VSAKQIDDVRCPHCRSATLVTPPIVIERTDPSPQRYRYCSFVECDWGCGGEDVIYEPPEPG
jgi:hypothetical protein